MVLAAAFGLTLAGVVFFEGVLLIRDFFVTAMILSPKSVSLGRAHICLVLVHELAECRPSHRGSFS